MDHSALAGLRAAVVSFPQRLTETRLATVPSAASGAVDPMTAAPVTPAPSAPTATWKYLAAGAAVLAAGGAYLLFGRKKAAPNEVAAPNEDAAPKVERDIRGILADSDDPYRAYRDANEEAAKVARQIMLETENFGPSQSVEAYVEERNRWKALKKGEPLYPKAKDYRGQPTFETKLVKGDYGFAEPLKLPNGAEVTIEPGYVNYALNPLPGNYEHPRSYNLTVRQGGHWKRVDLNQIPGLVRNIPSEQKSGLYGDIYGVTAEAVPEILKVLGEPAQLPITTAQWAE